MENAAFMEGMKAFKMGKLFEDNPYNLNPFIIFHQQWAKGWEAAYREYELFSCL